MERTWRLYFGPEFGDQKVSSITSGRIIELRGRISVTAKKPSTRNKIINHLKATLSFAVSKKYLRPEDLPRVKDEVVPKVKKPVFRSEDIDAMIAAGTAIDLEHEVFIRLLTEGCLRIGEVNALHWEDIDLWAGEATIQRTEWNHKIYPAPKGRVGTIPLSPELVDALRRWKKEGGNRGPLVLPMYDEEEKGWRCRHGGGLLEAIQRRAQVRISGTHLLKHSSLTLAARRKVSPLALQKLGRHSHPNVSVRSTAS